jgi:hypothetical protein
LIFVKTRRGLVGNTIIQIKEHDMAEKSNEFWIIGKVSENCGSGTHSIHVGRGGPYVPSKKMFLKILKAFRCTNHTALKGCKYPRLTGSARKDLVAFTENE